MTRRTFGAALACAGARAVPPEYWDIQRRGANWFNRAPTEDWLRAAAEKSIRLVRLAPDKWKPARRDFLIGDADRYTGLEAADLKRLIEVLGQASRHGVAFVLTMLSLPGARWRQLNNGRDDARLWKDNRYWDESFRFWRELAAALRGHPALAGVDPLNEPHPERVSGLTGFRDPGWPAWQERAVGTAADLNAFYRGLHQAVRAADPAVPFVVEPGWYATPWSVEFIQPIDDPRVLYSFHMYEPYEYTAKRLNQSRLRYPGRFRAGEVEQEWNRAALRAFLDPVPAWQRRHGIPANRIFAAEFGCSRTVPGAAAYLEDCVALFEEAGWHWAFYAFREDEWHEMDYELGVAPPGAAYWKAVEAGRAPDLRRSDEPLLSIFLRRMKR